MKHFKKEALLLCVVFAVAVVGLLQLFHEEAYARPSCTDTTYCYPTVNGSRCSMICGCPSGTGTTCNDCTDSPIYHECQ
jgi:hypothetical protein